MIKKFSMLAVALFAFAFISSSSNAQDLSTARGVIEAHIEATGGASAWNSIKDMYMEATVDVGTPMGDLSIELKSWAIFPGYTYTEMNLLAGPDGIPAEMVNMKAYSTPLEGWVENAQGRQDINTLPPQARQQFQRTTPKNELQFLSNPDSTLVLMPESTFNDRAVYVVGITSFGVESRFMFDKESLLIVAQETDTPAGAVTTTMSEYMEVNGLLFSGGQNSDNPQQSQKVTFNKIELDTGITPGELATKSGSRKAAAPE